MSADQVMRRCRSCKKQTLHVGPQTSHLLHLIMSVITAGVWIPIWLIVHISNSTRIACTVCGQQRGLFG